MNKREWQNRLWTIDDRKKLNTDTEEVTISYLDWIALTSFVQDKIAILQEAE